MNMMEKEARLNELERKIMQCQVIIDGEDSDFWQAMKGILSDKREQLYRMFCRLGDIDDIREGNFSSEREYGNFKAVQQGINQLESLIMMPKTMELQIKKYKSEQERIQKIKPQDKKRGQNLDTK